MCQSKYVPVKEKTCGMYRICLSKVRREIYARDGSTLDLPHLPMRPGWWEHERAFRQTIGNNGTQSQRLRRGFPCCARSVAIWQTSGNAGIAKPEATAQIFVLCSFGYRILCVRAILQQRKDNSNEKMEKSSQKRFCTLSCFGDMHGNVPKHCICR